MLVEFGDEASVTFLLIDVHEGCGKEGEAKLVIQLTKAILKTLVPYISISPNPMDTSPSFSCIL